jgi:hypothetical protein
MRGIIEGAGSRYCCAIISWADLQTILVNKFFKYDFDGTV